MRIKVSHEGKLKRFYKLFLKYKKKPIINYFNTNYKNNVLLSYTVLPFKNRSINYSHTNHIESLEIARVCKNLGFNIDIYNYDFEGKINYSKYSLIIGFGEPLINSYYSSHDAIIRIYYGTGMHVCVQNHNSLKRIKEVYNKKSVWLPESGRIVDKAWSIQTTIVNSIITFGNDKVLNTYRKYYDGDIYNIPVTYYSVIEAEDIESIINNKDYGNAKYHFLWFGSSGLIHKGLDLLLEHFVKNTNLHLHVCGPINKEQRFEKAYKQELYESKNIHTYGFVDIKSELFRQLMEKCLFIIFPSCSEGEPSSVVNLMANGIIPVVTETAGIRTKDFGYLVDELTINSINKTINCILQTRESELKLKSFKCYQDTRKTHSIETYSLKFQEHLETILEKYYEM